MTGIENWEAPPKNTANLYTSTTAIIENIYMFDNQTGYQLPGRFTPEEAKEQFARWFEREQDKSELKGKVAERDRTTVILRQLRDFGLLNDSAYSNFIATIIYGF